MSDTVKIVIEIDPHIIYAIQNNKGLSLGQQIDICNAIKNGIPLDDVKAEIDYERNLYLNLVGDSGYCNGLNKALKILNNIGKTESEVKPNE